MRKKGLIERESKEGRRRGCLSFVSLSKGDDDDKMMMMMMMMMMMIRRRRRRRRTDELR